MSIDSHLKETIKQLLKVKKQAGALAVFVDDRELPECPKCGLNEDVYIIGNLFSVSKNTPNKNKGLRF